MEIRRDESESAGGRRKKSGEETSSPIPWEDMTVVSVTGLRNFLLSLIAPASAEGKESGEKDGSTLVHAHEPQGAANTYLSRATHAYQTTGKAVHDRNIEEQPPVITTPDPSAISLGADFGEEEIDRIRVCIDHLAEMERNGVGEITLRRTLAFLDAIEQGILDAG